MWWVGIQQDRPEVVVEHLVRVEVLADAHPGLDEDGGPGPGAPHPDGGAGGGAGVGQPAHHLVRLVVRHTELLRQGGADLPALVCSAQSQVGTLGLQQQLLPDGSRPRLDRRARLAVECEEKFNFLWSRVMEESVGDIATRVQRGEFETELQELEIFTQDKYTINPVRNTGAKRESPLLVRVVPVDLKHSFNAAKGNVGIGEEFIFLARALLGSEVVLEGKFESCHEQRSCLARGGPECGIEYGDNLSAAHTPSKAFAKKSVSNPKNSGQKQYFKTPEELFLLGDLGFVKNLDRVSLQTLDNLLPQDKCKLLTLQTEKSRDKLCLPALSSFLHRGDLVSSPTPSQQDPHWSRGPRRK